jgi:MFS family permease
MALLEAGAIATIGVAADSLVAVLLAAAAFGAAYNTIISVTVLWGTRIYPDRPSAGAAAAVGGSAIGLLCGPLVGGIVADTIGLTATFLGGTAVVLAATLLKPNGDVIQIRRGDPDTDRRAASGRRPPPAHSESGRVHARAGSARSIDLSASPFNLTCRLAAGSLNETLGDGSNTCFVRGACTRRV